MLKKKRFIECVSKRINSGKCDLFVGSGISCESGMPSWREILQPMAEDIGVHLADEEDLPMIAQYIVNENSGNRNVIRTRLMEIFSDEHYATNRYHVTMHNMNVSTIWTTNYDHLIEQSMSGGNYCVISCDTDLVQPRNNKEEIEVIKVHGSIDSDPNEIVLTQQDYDEILFKKPAIAQRLRDTLIKKSILFIGYGYNDPDIRAIMIEAMKLMRDNSQEHYIILLNKKSKELEKDKRAKKQKKLRFKLWIKELNRIGIRELVVENSDELDEVLKDISLQSRGRNVFVTGSHTVAKLDKGQKLGRLLAQEEKICLINGQSDGMGKQILQGFMEECIHQKKDLGKKMRIYPNPYAANPDYANRAELIPILKKERRVLMTDVKVFAFFIGGMGTRAEYEVACECGCLILPLIAKSKDYSDKLIREFCSDGMYMGILKSKVPDYYKILKRHKVPNVKQLAEAIRRMVF